MNVILILVAFSLIVALIGLGAFFWSVRSGQYDDPYGSSVRILFEDEKPRDAEESAPVQGNTENPSNQK
ncbi:MAG: cbb3-type cytochrome oxidase assembly protein CcoS [Bacteroidetes bacterium]|nr:cbb3-type cytochrome oxidase assembly protein CcoS [Bacteroidota bacterium]